MFFFFFQAEDGIRDVAVTGVQTCALPILPGVKGVGEKTALELLKTFGDLDAILANAERISGKRAREAVQQHADLARLSRGLVTIKSGDAPGRRAAAPPPLGSEKHTTELPSRP